MNESKDTTIALNVRLKPSDSSAHPRAANYTNVGVAQGYCLGYPRRNGRQYPGEVAVADSTGVGGVASSAEAKAERLRRRRSAGEFSGM